jgi:hypothetical protein
VEKMISKKGIAKLIFDAAGVDQKMTAYEKIGKIMEKSPETVARWANPANPHYPSLKQLEKLANMCCKTLGVLDMERLKNHDGR